MITYTSAEILAKNTRHGSGQLIWLVELWRDSATPLRFARAQADVTFEGYTWTACALVVKPQPQDMAGGHRRFDVQVQNVDTVLGIYVRSGEIKGQYVRLLRVRRSCLSDSTSGTKWRGKVHDAAGDDRWIAFSCGADDWKDNRPGRKFRRLRCDFDFKGPLGECGYTGGLTTCTKTPDDCRNNKTNFTRIGCFPSIPSRRP